MSRSNKGARRMLERIFGKICMIEHLGIRNIPKSKRKRVKGYRRTDDMLTYHHIHEKALGGKTTIANGALLKGYNHVWLHHLPDDQRRSVNNAILEFKATMIQIVGDQVRTVDGEFICFEITDEFPSQNTATPKSIKVYDNDEVIERKRARFSRAKERRQFQKSVRQGLEDYLDNK